MENIYVQTEQERNSLTELPEGFAERCGDTLYSWLGSLWRGLNEGDAMVRGLQAARGLRLAQLYLDILEAAQLRDRNGAPVFHRELWHPIVLRRSQRDTSQENLLRIGMNGEIGPQPDGSAYGEGTVFRMGRMANLSEFATYPMPKEVAGGAASIVDNIVNPGVVLRRGVDYLSDRKELDYWIVGDSIVFRRDADPLSAESRFEKYDVPGDGDGPGDVEAVVWASDVLFDRNYVSDHISYALGANAPSSAVVKRILNAAWSSVASGLTPELARTLMAAMLNVPVIQRERETVVDIVREDSGTTVLTDSGAYRVSPKAKLRSCIYSGSVLRRGDLMDESLRIYPFLNVADAGAKTGFSVPLEQDVPSVTIPPGMLSVRTKYGIYAMWRMSVVKAHKGNRNHLYFDVGGDEDDVEAFWREVWDRVDAAGIDMYELLGIRDVGDMVSPARFFLRNLVGANTIFVVVDQSQLDDSSMMRDPMFFDMLSSVVPSAVRLFLVEHRPVAEDVAHMGDASESGAMFAALPKAEESVSEGVIQGLSGRGPMFGERVSARFVRPSPAKVRGGKEREDK